MITSIPTEIQQLVLIKLPVSTRTWPMHRGSQKMRHSPVNREEVEFRDWMHMPLCYRAACLSQDSRAVLAPCELVESTIRFAVMHGILTASVPRNSPNNNFISDNQLTNILSWAAERGAVDAVRLLLRCGIHTSEEYMHIPPSILNAYPAFDPSIDNSAPLALACQHLLSAARNGHEDVVRLLLSDPRRDGDESAALVKASYAGHIRIVDLLLKDGRAKGSWENSACLREACRQVSSPFREAQHSGHTDVLEYLL
ncbi:hypothetical protein BJ741DRAFT_653680 [Chytriomyces cf. hyalinus JEL632]|nr:hypothetical protein BJ741DRAFT_653680 [Chytriomyces cf. hyalinus JEL632]